MLSLVEKKALIVLVVKKNGGMGGGGLKERGAGLLNSMLLKGGAYKRGGLI